MLEKLKAEICELNRQLLRWGLVVWTSGNVSGIERDKGLVAIKPSGVAFDELTPDAIALVDLDGRQVEGPFKASVDSASHLVVYRRMRHVGGIAHTHSTYATAFAAAARPIPPVLTAIADEFGGPVPVGAYCEIGGEQIGEELVRSIGDSPAILLKNHGVFTVGPTPEAALKAAVMVEDVARTVALAEQLDKGGLAEIPPEEIARAHNRYMKKYGRQN
ncbi:MAG: class II aldolase/adducin family protein [Verrucomicrobia bacterium]|nr:class II aldolase/adducin family protein [Verrucomicrobiota bacterium]